MDWAKIYFHYLILLLSYYSFEMVSMSSLFIKKVNTLHYMCINKILICFYKTRRNEMKEMKCSNMELPTQFNKICKYHVTIYILLCICIPSCHNVMIMKYLYFVAKDTLQFTEY